MKKLTRKSLDELAKTLPVLSEEEQRCCVGGGTVSCVFNCFDHIDGERFTADHYYQGTLDILGYAPGDNGGVNTSDLGAIGAMGGFNVKEIGPPFTLTKDGLVNGCNVIMTFYDEKAEIDHAVVVTGFEYTEGKLHIKYYDPTTGINDSRAESDYSGLYSVDARCVDSPVSSPSGIIGGSGIYYA